MNISALTLAEAKSAYSALSLMDGSETYRAARLRYVPEAKSLADVFRVQTALFKRLSTEAPGWAKADLASLKSGLRLIATETGYLGGRAGTGKSKRRKTTLTSKSARKLAASRSPESQRRTVDYAALGRKGVEARKKSKKEGEVR